jgi:hypothetical protein
MHCIYLASLALLEVDSESDTPPPHDAISTSASSPCVSIQCRQPTVSHSRMLRSSRTCTTEVLSRIRDLVATSNYTPSIASIVMVFSNYCRPREEPATRHLFMGPVCHCAAGLRYMAHSKFQTCQTMYDTHMLNEQGNLVTRVVTTRGNRNRTGPLITDS